MSELTGIPDNPEKAAKTFILENTAKVIVTLGKQGCMLAERDRAISYYDAVPADVVDTTAAGDCFTGALAMALSADGNGSPLKLFF